MYCVYQSLIEQDEEGVGMSDLEIRNEVDTFMFEGYDTTANGRKLLIIIILMACPKQWLLSLVCSSTVLDPVPAGQASWAPGEVSGGDQECPTGKGAAGIVRSTWIDITFTSVQRLYSYCLSLAVRTWASWSIFTGASRKDWDSIPQYTASSETYLKIWNLMGIPFQKVYLLDYK